MSEKNKPNFWQTSCAATRWSRATKKLMNKRVKAVIVEHVRSREISLWLLCAHVFQRYEAHISTTLFDFPKIISAWLYLSRFYICIEAVTFRCNKFLQRLQHSNCCIQVKLWVLQRTVGRIKTIKNVIPEDGVESKFQCSHFFFVKSGRRNANDDFLFLFVNYRLQCSFELRITTLQLWQSPRDATNVSLRCLGTSLTVFACVRKLIKVRLITSCWHRCPEHVQLICNVKVGHSSSATLSHRLSY